MKFQNKYNLPGPVVTALTAELYDMKNPPENVISVTGLIKAPKVKILESRHDAEIEVDVSERLWMLLGTACHYVIEQASGYEHITEGRWFLDCAEGKVYQCEGDDIPAQLWYNPKTIYLSGKFDLYDPTEKKLTDYKITSVWSWTLEKCMKKDHDQQLQMNAFALRLLGHSVEKLSIMMMFRDWSKTKAKTDYPDLPVPMKEIFTPLWNDDDIMRFIDERIKLHYEARKKTDDDIPVCKPEERWAKATKYAVMKVGKKRAEKLYDSKPEPEFMVKMHPGCVLVERPGADTKCVDYCNANTFCNYWKDKYGNAEAETSENEY